MSPLSLQHRQEHFRDADADRSAKPLLERLETQRFRMNVLSDRKNLVRELPIVDDAVEMAHRLLAAGESLERVAALTGLPFEQVKALSPEQ